MEPLDTQHGHAMAASPALLALVSKPETTTYSEVASDARAEWWQTTHQTGMSPSYHHLLSPWLPLPFDQPVGPSETTAPFPERRLEPREWVELLEQTECLDYVSPDVDACIEMQSRMEGNQELELTGTEFMTSPAIPKLPSLISLSVERATNLTSMAQPQDTLSRRPGLREKFPRQQLSTDYNEVHYAHNYLPTVERLVDNKRTTRGDSSASRRSSERRSANRSLKFEVPQQNNTARRKRASWCGHSARAKDNTPSRRQCKSARKSKDCMIPGCTKGARSRGLCKRHGGGKRCTFSGCVRSDQGGGFCIAHGGGKRCATEGCKNSAQSRGRCKSHGGGKRCRAEGCAKSSQGGGFCRGHGAGRASNVKTADTVF